MKLGMNYKRYDSGQLWLGVFFVLYAIVAAVFIFPGATKSQSAVLYILIFGGLFVGIPAALGIGVTHAQLKLRKNRHGKSENSN